MKIDAITSLVASVIFAGVLSATLTAQTPAGETEPPPPQPAFAPAPANPGSPQNKPAAFNAEMSADFMRKVMETSAKIEAVKKEMAERRAELFETNSEIKSCREQMVDLQNKINSILAEDRELAKMEMDRDILWTTMPPMPGARMRPGMPRGMFPAMHK